MYEELVKRLRIDQRLAKFAAEDVAKMPNTIFGEAANAIENLQKELEKEKAFAECWEELAQDCKNRFSKLADAFPKWIPVTERLPDCEWGSEIGNVEWISHGCVYAGCFGRGGKWRDAYFRTWTDGTEGIDAKDAERWRIVQIPSPPKEHGRWIMVDDTKCRCSECDVIHFIAQYPHGEANFCPNCGAKMDEVS